MKAECSICHKSDSHLMRDIGWPNRVCRSCDAKAVTKKGEIPNWDSMYDCGDNPVFIEGVKCWRRYRFGGYVTMRDNYDCNNLGTFYDKLAADGLIGSLPGKRALQELNQREDVIKKRLDKMREWASQRRDFQSSLPLDWEEDWYIRIGGNGFHAVSVNDSTPLLGFTSKPTQKIKIIESQFRNKTPRRSVKSKPVPERRIQSWLIKQALCRGGDLKSILEFHNHEELLFALDEVSLGDRKNKPIIRCDILAVGVQKGRAFPVIIELKSSRYLQKLFDQSWLFQDEMERFNSEFDKLLSVCVNKDVQSKGIGIGRILIMPQGTGKDSNTIQRCKRDHVGLIEYIWDHHTSVDNIKFCQRSVFQPQRQQLDYERLVKSVIR